MIFGVNAVLVKYTACQDRAADNLLGTLLLKNTIQMGLKNDR